MSACPHCAATAADARHTADVAYECPCGRIYTAHASAMCVVEPLHAPRPARNPPPERALDALARHLADFVGTALPLERGPAGSAPSEDVGPFQVAREREFDLACGAVTRLSAVVCASPFAADVLWYAYGHCGHDTRTLYRRNGADMRGFDRRLGEVFATPSQLAGFRATGNRSFARVTATEFGADIRTRAERTWAQTAIVDRQPADTRRPWLSELIARVHRRVAMCDQALRELGG